MAMISEEMKEISILGKYMKLLGVYQTLIDGFDPSVAARFSDEVGVKELYNELKTRNLITYKEYRIRLDEFWRKKKSETTS
jgi:hypothetical protein